MPANPAATINPQVARQPAVPASGASAELPSPEKSAPAVTPGEPAVAESGTVQAIDAGDVFNRIFAEAEQPGKGDSIAQAHRALERETRDDGWAYSMEAEIQNTFVNEVSMGSFRADHVECRSTMCELRLSGRGDQAAAIKRWTEELGGQPFGQRLFLNYSSSISDNNRVDTVMIFRRPPKQK
jgi:hypothetical protein